MTHTHSTMVHPFSCTWHAIPSTTCHPDPHHATTPCCNTRGIEGMPECTCHTQPTADQDTRQILPPPCSAMEHVQCMGHMAAFMAQFLGLPPTHLALGPPSCSEMPPGQASWAGPIQTSLILATICCPTGLHQGGCPKPAMHGMPIPRHSHGTRGCHPTCSMHQAHPPKC